MPAGDDVEAPIADPSQDDPTVGLRVAAALARREHPRQLAGHRREAGLSQTEIAERMGTSQGQVARFESGAETRLSSVARYAAALGVTVSRSIRSAA